MDDQFVHELPKLELHVHIEGTLTPELRWQLAQKNGVHLPYDSLDALRSSYQTMYNHRKELHGDNGLPTFLEAYYGGMEVLHKEDDFYELAMQYLRKASSMHVRYAEPFFDIQAHTRRNIPVAAVMEGLKRAKADAARELDVHCNWILCFLRDMSPESAMQAYEACIPYKGTVFCGIGLDSNEYNRPPTLFDAVFQRARADGLKITSHCDVGQKDTHAHIEQVASRIAGHGTDRIDHGLNAAERPDLIELIRRRDLGMTLCPHAYHRRNPTDYVFPLVRKLFDAGIKVTVNSDDPTYMHNMWVEDNLRLVQQHCQFTRREMIRLQMHAVEISWCGPDLKGKLMDELTRFDQVWGDQL
ncbi:putative adenosine deaminase protein [Lasiodiplodia theobromae]|uniref:Putative deaminase n=1 Tax=Lasiodiplodia theobromae TaxID=45133 RepID=A0A5N5CXI2_9PEZI|nr:Adenosine deaminase [Lasiodiplodia theobromae]KAB2570079.1 putative deaminase [Lasiodiplodia theobromae]KAF4543258.1 Adenosine deaminase [Lasiodiplodia theobromae]KAF9636410.1 putative adenosine deaminase protein [Lasiodiplodia theobromae]